MSTERVTIDLADNGVAQVRLNRPDKMNALDPAQFEAIINVGEQLRSMEGLRAVVLAGEGRAFCAGLDVSSFTAAVDTDRKPLAERTHGNANAFQEVAMTWRKCPVPVVAAVHGVCFGGGLQIASGADIRVVHPASRMAIMELKWGLVPDMGGYHLWRGLVRDDILRELVYTNREFSGTEAHSYGLATHVSEDPLGKATDIANEIANRNPDAIRGAKRLSEAMLENSGDEILLAESLEQAAVMRTPNQIEAVMAGMQKRPAKYTDTPTR
ncbi:MAG: enoyl-CoA hydratase [Erythrobacter sp.]|nr:enoyl-CoA hydratase [Erythrobacter sp.]|tara:strand:- start:473 stop:1279 length:807 start_codon:yes stop_codon:yes gene_type:complete